MIDNPIIEMLLLIFTGFCIGIVVYQWYIFRVGKNVFLKLVALIGVKIKSSDITAKQVWNIVNNIIDRILEETEREEGKIKFKDKIKEPPK